MRIPAPLLVLAAFSLLSCAHASAEQNWLDPTLGGSFGVQVKEERTTGRELDQIKDAGLHYVRFVIPWYSVERTKDFFAWGHFDSFVKRLRNRDLGAVIVLGAGHPLYTKQIEAPRDNIDQTPYYLAAPTTEEERKAFVRYALKTVEHFGTDDIIWELWNEPDSDRFWAPKANVEDYIALADQTCRAIKQRFPAAKIIGPGMADMPGRFGHLLPGFLGKILRSPAGECFDAVSVHPYRNGEKPPETVLRAHENLRAYIDAFNNRNLPVLATEWGFTTVDVTPEAQAAFLLRSFLLNRLSGVPVSIWYEWRDAREGDCDPEAHYGLLDLQMNPKEAYKALRAFLPPLSEARLEARLPLGSPDDFVLRLGLPDNQKALVFWSAAKKPGRKLVIKDPKGKDETWPLTALPQTVLLKKEAPEPSLVPIEEPL